MGTDIDVEKLIDAVQSRPALYDTSYKEYRDARLKATCWEEVGVEMYENWSRSSFQMRKVRAKLLSKKWKTLRDNFVRDYKLLAERGSLGNKKKYIYFDHLMFLSPFVKHSTEVRASKSNKDEEGAEEMVIPGLWDDLSFETADESTTQDFQDSPPPKKNLRRRNKKPDNKHNASNHLIQELGGTSTVKEDSKADKYGNRAFLTSYIPIMDSLTQQEMLHTRMLITQVFLEKRKWCSSADDQQVNN